MTEIPFDIPSFDTKKHGASFIWPTRYSEYDFLSYDFIDGAVKILQSQTGDASIALTCKLSDITIDISNLMRQAVDLHNAQMAQHNLAYTKEYSPTCDWLLNSCGANDFRIVERLNPRSRDSTLKANLILKARQAKRKFQRQNSDHSYNAINYNLLMQEWIESENETTFNLLTEVYAHGKPQYNKAVIELITKAFQNLVFKAYDTTSDLKANVELAIKMIIEHHMSQALGDLNHLKSSKLHKNLRKGLISGTPKYEGRLLSWYFREHGKDVVRFAHGGERVFYEDYAWPIAELPYCTKYYAHSQAEAQNMQHRLGNGQYVSFKAVENINFLSKGSEKHKKLYKSATTSIKNRTLVYVTSVYEHDSTPGLPAFKVPDVLYFEFQTRLLSFLKKEGWHIILKPHPKGIYQNQEYLKQYVDGIVKTPFNPNSFQAEIFLFDFAGTAFFDTLATKQRALLLNLGGRPIDIKERKNLQKRCEVLDIGFNKKGSIEMEEDKIRTAIQKAPENINDDFIKNYAF